MSAGTAPGPWQPRLRLAVALGDPDREQALLPALSETGEFIVADRYLAADQLLEAIRSGRVDVALVAFDLHRLSGSKVSDLARTGLPLVLLAAPPDDPRWRSLPWVIVPPAASAPDVIRALALAVRGQRLRPAAPAAVHPPPPDGAATASLPAAATGAPLDVIGPKCVGQSLDAVSVIAVASGHGSPGRTTVALNLATALGAVAPTVLVDADFSRPSVAAFLDADPTRNLSMLAHAEPETAGEWQRALEQETQPLASRSPHGQLLCGVPKPEMRGGVSSHFFERLLVELGQRYRYVVLDVGADLVGADMTVHRTALGIAHRVLLVAAADLVGLWQAHRATGVLQTHVQLHRDRLALVINRYDRRYHHSRLEVEWALGVGAAVVVPYDHGGAQRAIAAQRPVVLDAGSRAGRALVDLAERVHGDRLMLPPEPARQAGSSWLCWPVQPYLARLARLHWCTWPLLHGRVRSRTPDPTAAPSRGPTASASMSAAAAVSPPGAVAKPVENGGLDGGVVAHAK